MMTTLRRKGACSLLRDNTVRNLVHSKRRLVEVPYTATLSDTVNALVANNIVAVPVAAPPGHWIGAGGTMIMESDKVTGVVRKQYIGMVTMLDVLLHIAAEAESEEEGGGAGGVLLGGVDVQRKMLVPVSSVIGHSLEGLSLWTLNPNTSIIDCMETFSKGVHRALIPLESHTENVIAAELVEASPGYRMLTQMDVLVFLREHADELKNILSCSIGQLGAVNENVFAVTKHTKVLEAIKAMRTAALNAVPVVEDTEMPGDNQILLDGKGKKLVDTFSATDLRGCSVAQLQSWLSITVVEFKERVSSMVADELTSTRRKLITCHHESSLGDVMEKAVDAHVHRVWVVDREGLLKGLISLTDMLRVIREAVLQTEQDLGDVETPSIQ
ncbi:SNF1-related protein kinase regulatory subunit gamma-like PV42a [Iris pallida]|uniref:SNF1-related protein kinase regulatory subunit gamma-like PV42a n=1 Tax=Iris pallida TaxID=29817 RepID=A0AAX6IAS6_IRIPA|nr:SNF1-related protein kinase regulatory subunit gamma-like PV42a [Iris pallida]